MVAATGDWTKNTPRIEYPAMRRIYGLFSAEDKVHSVQFDAPHNYNRDSRNRDNDQSRDGGEYSRWRERDLHDFCDGGAPAYGQLVFDPARNRRPSTHNAQATAAYANRVVA